jgi:hypothetical protein
MMVGAMDSALAGRGSWEQVLQCQCGTRSPGRQGQQQQGLFLLTMLRLPRLYDSCCCSLNTMWFCLCSHDVEHCCVLHTATGVRCCSSLDQVFSKLRHQFGCLSQVGEVRVGPVDTCRHAAFAFLLKKSVSLLCVQAWKQCLLAPPVPAWMGMLTGLSSSPRGASIRAAHMHRSAYHNTRA